MSQFRYNPLLFALITTLLPLSAGCGLSGSNTNTRQINADSRGDAGVFREIGIQAQTRRSPVLAYDATTLQEAESQITRLAKEGWQFLSLAQLHRRLAGGAEIPAKSVVLTFDMTVQKFYTGVYPLLQKRHLPSALFVTNPLKEGDDATLAKLDKEDSVAVGNYWSVTEQNRAVVAQRKSELEAALGRSTPYVAYANNDNPATPQTLAKEGGYTMAFSTQEGLAQESPSILALNRYTSLHLDKALTDFTDRNKTLPLAVVDTPMRNAYIELQIREWKGFKLAMLIGGRPSFRHDERRRSVGEFINEANGAAGSSGTFFTDARMRGTPNESLVGPYACDGVFKPDEARYSPGAINNRPMILWGDRRVAIFPFQSGYMNRNEVIKRFMPDFTDCFLGGAWIVHNGVARSKEEWATNSVPDIHDPRFRIFFGITKEGVTVVAASMSVITTEKLAEVAQETGIKEAILLDSGFSTSIIYLNRVVVTGHTDLDIPSRPVPSSIVLRGALAPIADIKLVTLLDNALPATGEGALETNEKLQWASNRKRLSRKADSETDEP